MIENQGLTGLRLLKHPAKTFIGKTEKEFDFLGACPKLAIVAWLCWFESDCSIV